MNPERGNVMFYILIAVALLAALITAVAQSGRGSIKQVGEEKSRLLASEITEYANSIANAVAQLRLRGVKETDLCFDDANWGGANYNHAGCGDDINKIFHLSGGGITWKNAPEMAMDNAAAPDDLWHIYADNEVQNIGTTCGAAACADLILVVNELSLEVCKQINTLLDVTDPDTAPPGDTGIGTTRYIGVYGYDETIGNEASELSGKTAACLHETAAPNEYVFYKVLIAR